MPSILHAQLERCHIALKLFDRCMKERQWHKVTERSDRISKEMELLRLNLIDQPEMNDELAGQVQYLDIQLRRIQRRFSIHISAVSADVETLKHGISKGEAAKAILQAT